MIKKVLVTGSSKGIGLSIARLFINQDCQVILHGLEPQEMIQSELNKSLGKSNHDRINYITADFRDVSDIEKLAAEVISAFGGVDILVNNAGIQYVSAVDDFPVGMWNDIMAVNINASFHTTRLFLPNMRKNNWGRIINISSVHGLVASPNKSAYVSAKHALIGLTKTVALELADTNITCNTICPGAVNTQLLRSQVEKNAANKHISFDESFNQILESRMPVKSLIDPDSIAEFVYFLTKEHASHITGASLSIDGAWTSQ